MEIRSAYCGKDLRAAEARVLKDSQDDTLMQRAAAALAVACAELLRDRRGRVSGRRVVLLVGTGNNGGDALLAGARLRARGAWVDALLVDRVAYGPGVAAVRAAGGRIVDCRADGGADRARELIRTSDLVVDGVVGLGGSGGLRELAAELVAEIPRNVPVVAVDLPSGVDPDTGEVLGVHVRADVTVTFGALKPCLLVPPAAHAAGHVVFVDVGVLGELTADPVVERLTPRGVAARWPVPVRTDHKYTRGVLGVVAGSDHYPGAAVLACAGAVRAGAGVVRFIGPHRVTDHVLAARPEVVPGIGQVQAWLLGSGVEDDPQQDDAIATALGSGLPCVVDAGALRACVEARAAGQQAAAAEAVLLTPHAGELARMLGVLGHEVTRDEVEARPMHHALWLARDADATVLLKGSTTLIASPSGRLLSQDDGPPWMATAGSGDVLAGIAGALLAAGISALEAGAMAALVHGRAGRDAAGGGPLAAADIAAAVPETVAALLRGLPATR
jgi:hydroxyethylthiazole kinase-like uncharacterized protein yjeF